jgi:sugar/nucleoside kinase (ribokinase family)
MKQQSAYLYGMILCSHQNRLATNFPGPDGYAEVAETVHTVSGETANAAIVLARLGLGCKVDGNWIGGSTSSTVLEGLTSFGVDVSRLVPRSGYSGPEEFIFSDPHTRTVFGPFQKLLFTDQQWNEPEESDIESADLCLVDPMFGEQSLKAARLAKTHGKPLVGIDCAYDSELLDHYDVVAVSKEHLGFIYPGKSREELFPRYLKRAAGLVVMTDGGKNILYGRKGGPAQCLEGFRVETVDTLGAGDSFKAGLGYGLIQGMGDLEMVRFAAALAAINCTRFPGVRKSPTLAEVETFLAERV